MTELQAVYEHKIKPQRFITAKIKTPKISGTIRGSLKNGYGSSKYMTASKGKKVLFESFISSGERRWTAVKPVIPKIFVPPKMVLPSLHLFLGPFYVVLGIMSFVLAMDISYLLSQATAAAFYTTLGDLGPTLTVLAATIFVWRLYKKYRKA